MLQISEIVKQTEDMFDLFNSHFYSGELTRPSITVSSDSGCCKLGFFNCLKIGANPPILPPGVAPRHTATIPLAWGFLRHKVSGTTVSVSPGQDRSIPL